MCKNRSRTCGMAKWTFCRITKTKMKFIKIKYTSMRNTMTHVHIAFDKLRSLAIYYLVDEGFECPLHTLVRQGFFFLFVVKLKIIACKLLCLDLFLFLSSTSFFFFGFIVSLQSISIILTHKLYFT